jgi:phosphate transport system ATP-binding protein
MSHPLMELSPLIVFDNFSASFGGIAALRRLNLKVFAQERLAIIGPAGSGKTTLLRCLNRWHDLTSEFQPQGQIFFAGQSIFDPGTSVAQLRRQLALVSSQMATLPTSIFENVALGIRISGEHRQHKIFAMVEFGLREAHLWEEVKARLEAPAQHLSSDIRRRLTLARALAFDPQVLLLDEPCAGLDNTSSILFEDLIQELATKRTVILATNDIKQAARASDKTAFLLKGELIEWGPTRTFFTHPAERLTHDFITERF